MPENLANLQRETQNQFATALTYVAEGRPYTWPVTLPFHTQVKPHNWPWPNSWPWPLTLICIVEVKPVPAPRGRLPELHDVPYDTPPASHSEQLIEESEPIYENTKHKHNSADNGN